MTPLTGASKLSPTVACSSVDAMLAAVREHAARTVSAGVGLNALMPFRDGWMGLLSPEGSPDGRIEAAPAGILVEPAGHDAWRMTTVHADEDPELSAVADVVGGVVPAAWRRASIVRGTSLRAYRPLRRAQVQVDTHAGSVFVKVLRRKAWRRVVDRHTWLEHASHDSGGFAVPVMLGIGERQRALACEGVEAPSLFEVLTGNGAEETLTRVGTSLSRFHGADVAGTRTEGLEPLPPAPSGWEWCAALRDRLALLRDRSGARAAQLAHDLLRAAPSSGASGVVHGDLHDKQLLCAASITYLDVDGVAVGDPAIDVGNLLAHLRLRRLQERARAPYDVLRETLVDAYPGMAQAVFRRAAMFYEAASLARLAAVYALRPRWRHLSPELFRLATLGGGSL